MFQDVEEYITNPRSKDSCNLINETTGTKSSKQGVIRSKNKKNSINRWYVHFEDMLGLEPVVEECLEKYIEAILNNFRYQVICAAKRNILRPRMNWMDEKFVALMTIQGKWSKSVA